MTKEYNQSCLYSCSDLREASHWQSCMFGQGILRPCYGPDSRIDTLVWTRRPSSFTAAPNRAAPSTWLPNKKQVKGWHCTSFNSACPSLCLLFWPLLHSGTWLCEQVHIVHKPKLQTTIDGQLFPGHAVCFVSYKQVLSHDVIWWDEKCNLSFQVPDVIPSFLYPSLDTWTKPSSGSAFIRCPRVLCLGGISVLSKRVLQNKQIKQQKWPHPFSGVGKWLSWFGLGEEDVHSLEDHSQWGVRC